MYGSKGVIPAEVLASTYRIQGYETEANQLARAFDLTMLDAKRSLAVLRTQQYQAVMARAYNQHVKKKDFQIGDLVLRRADILKHIGKLEPNWEGPYKVVKSQVNGSYMLEDLEGIPLQRTWNAKNLRRFYS